MSFSGRNKTERPLRELTYGLMAFSEALAQRVRDILYPLATAEEKKMFGGLALMVNGNMTVGVIQDDLIVRVGLEKYQAATRQTGR